MSAANMPIDTMEFQPRLFIKISKSNSCSLSVCIPVDLIAQTYREEPVWQC